MSLLPDLCQWGGWEWWPKIRLFQNTRKPVTDFIFASFWLGWKKTILQIQTSRTVSQTATCWKCDIWYTLRVSSSGESLYFSSLFHFLLSASIIDKITTHNSFQARGRGWQRFVMWGRWLAMRRFELATIKLKSQDIHRLNRHAYLNKIERCIWLICSCIRATQY